MQRRGTVTLYTDRLILRRFVIEDAEDMFNNWANDPEVTKFLSWEPHGDIEITKKLLSQWVKSYDNPDTYNWAVVLNDTPIGSVSLLHPDNDKREAEGGYCLSRDYWGKEIMPEAFSAVIKYAFEEVGFRRIYAKHNVQNPNSGKVMLKCGMKYIGTKNAPLALKPDKIVMCDCYEIINPYTI